MDGAWNRNRALEIEGHKIAGKKGRMDLLLLLLEQEGVLKPVWQDMDRLGMGVGVGTVRA